MKRKDSEEEAPASQGFEMDGRPPESARPADRTSAQGAERRDDRPAATRRLCDERVIMAAKRQLTASDSMVRDAPAAESGGQVTQVREEADADQSVAESSTARPLAQTAAPQAARPAACTVPGGDSVGGKLAQQVGLDCFERLQRLYKAAGGELHPDAPAVLLQVETPANIAELMTGGGYCMFASANFERLVLGCINENFDTQILI